MDSSSEQEPAEIRAVALAALAAECVLLGWEARGEWRTAGLALLLVHLIGLVGFGLYSLARRGWRGPPASHTELFLSSGLSAALVTLIVTYGAGEWMGVRSAVGSFAGGMVVGVTLVLARLAIRGPVASGESEVTDDPNGSRSP